MTNQSDFFGVSDAPAKDALGYLIQFARARPGQAFSPEAVTLSAVDHGIVFSDMRSWGAIFSQASRDGHIRPSTELFPRTMSNGSMRPGWVGA